MNAHQTLILASSSPRRQELVRSLGLPYEIMVSEADETTPPGMAPADIVTTLSLRKAEVVRDKMNETPGVILGADTIVVSNGEVLGKPVDEEDAYRMLHRLQGNIHEVYSGMALLGTGVSASVKLEEEIYFGEHSRYRVIARRENAAVASLLGYSVTQVKFKPLSDAQIRSYIAKGESSDKAGAYAIQNIGATLVESIVGDYFNVVGLPISLLSVMLERFDLHVLSLMEE
ncbi:MAG: septum formation protein Maf [Gorillibacterium sp.]|nr:septum formation protein Maf [Gorillibacterium sp.]